MSGLKEKWDYPDVVYRSKKISKYTIELVGGTERGAEIKIWKKIDKYWMGEKYEPLSGHDYILEEIHFMHFANALDEYNELKTVKDIYDLMRMNN